MLRKFDPAVFTKPPTKNKLENDNNSLENFARQLDTFSFLRRSYLIFCRRMLAAVNMAV